MNQPIAKAQQPQAINQESSKMAMNHEVKSVATDISTLRTVGAEQDFDYLEVPPVARTGISEEQHREKVEAELKVYMTRRDKLNETAKELNRLKKTLSALEHQEKTADIAWRQDFVKGFGKQSKPMRDQLKQKTQWKLEAEQTREMVTLLEPQVEWLKMHTYVARKTFLTSLRSLNDLVEFNRLIAGINGLSDIDSMRMIRDSLPRLFSQIETKICNDVGYMATFHLDVSRQRGTGIYANLSNHETAQVKSKVRFKQMAALGELLMRRLPKHAEPVTALDVPSRLDCEANSTDMPSSLMFPGRLKELEAKMEYVPSLKELDNSHAA